MAKNDNGQESMNAMWLAEEMWERHHAAMRSVKNIEFSTYMMAFCMTLMEYIWMPHDIIKAITTQMQQDACEQLILTLGFLTTKGFQHIWQIKFDSMGKPMVASVM